MAGVHRHNVLVPGDGPEAAADRVALPMHRRITAQALKIMTYGVGLEQARLAHVDTFNRQRKGFGPGFVSGQVVGHGGVHNNAPVSVPPRFMRSFWPGTGSL